MPPSPHFNPDNIPGSVFVEKGGFKTRPYKVQTSSSGYPPMTASALMFVQVTRTDVVAGEFRPD
jgi:hypothetical protein